LYSQSCIALQKCPTRPYLRLGLCNYRGTIELSAAIHCFTLIILWQHLITIDNNYLLFTLCGESVHCGHHVHYGLSSATAMATMVYGRISQKPQTFLRDRLLIADIALTARLTAIQPW
jgi:hypothetical protein